MKKYIFIIVLFVAYFTAVYAVSNVSNKEYDPQTFIPPKGAFETPKGAPETTITANRLSIKDGLAILEGNVRARQTDKELTCEKAFLRDKPRRLLASITPRIYYKERVVERKVVQELNLEAKNIAANEGTGVMTASPSVHLRVEERSWDLASFSWCVITSEAMLAIKDSERIIFTGRVNLIDGDNNKGHGNRLDYARKLGVAVLSGNAEMEYWELNKDTKQKEKRTMKGNVITYNLETKEAIAE